MLRLLHIGSRTPPLVTQAFYFPAGQGGVGATINTQIQPTSWMRLPSQGDGRACPGCFAAGDYQNIISNSYAAASTPFIQESSRIDDLFQNFIEDPVTVPNVPNFRPNFIPFTTGADLKELAAYPCGVPVMLPPFITAAF